MSTIGKFIRGCIKTFSKLKVKVSDLITSIIEAGRTNSYVETVSNKADTLHRYAKENTEQDLKRAFEFNTKKAIWRKGLRNVVLAIDPTKELYYGKNGKMNVRQIKHEKGAGEAFSYAVLEIIKPNPLPLMAIPYRQGDDLTNIIKELLEYAKSLPIIIEYVLFDREFNIGELIDYLSSRKIKYLIFVPENSAMKRYIAETDEIASFAHVMKYNKYFSNHLVETKIVIIKDQYFNKKKNKWENFYWCFATNLRTSRDLIRKYKQRWQIETDFRIHDEARIKSKSNEPIIRYFYFLVSLILVSNWEVNRLIHPEMCFKKYLKFVQGEFEKEGVT